jgi:hypothetical protein
MVIIVQPFGSNRKTWSVPLKLVLKLLITALAQRESA